MTSPLHNWTHETWIDFLTDNFHLLSKLTKVESFLPWLRQKRVLTEYDEEDILSRNTSALRSARLLDTIKYKGTKGATAYMEVVEWVYPEVYASIAGTPRPPPDEFQCAKEEVPSFRKSRFLLDQLQKCMGTILNENSWKREDIIQLRETVQRLKAENESVIVEMKFMREKMEKSIEEAEELKATNRELKESLEKVKSDNIRQSSRDISQYAIRRVDCHKDTQAKDSHLCAKDCSVQFCNELNNRCKCLEENLARFGQELEQKEIENERQRREIDQLLDLNQRLKTDYQKAVKTSQNQQEKLDFYKIENEKISDLVCQSSGVNLNGSPDIILVTTRRLERKKGVKKKNPDK